MASISEPDDHDLRARGLGEVHVRHAFIEVLRHLFAAGHSVAYGGDLRRGGYTETIVDLLRTYRRRDVDSRTRFKSYLAWPAQLDLTPAALAELRTFATPVLLERPANLPAIPGAEPDPTQSLLISSGYSEMREQIVSESDCLLVLGGRTYGQVGLVPGVQEEVYLALLKRIPVFIAGGFGGSAAAISQALSGEIVESFSREYHVEKTPEYAARVAAADHGGGYLTPEAVGEAFRTAGWAGNTNYLTADENQRLATTDDVDEVVALLMRALRQLSVA